VLGEPVKMLSGAVVYPVVFARLEPSVGFRWATRAIAFMMLATSIVTVAGVRQRTQPTLNRSALFDTASFRDAPFIHFSLGVFFDFMGIYVLFFYVELYGLQVCHMNSNLAAYLLAIVNAGSLFGRLIPNYMADKVGPLNIHVPFAFVTALLAFSWIAVRDAAGLVVFGVLYGFFSGTFVSLPGPIVVGISMDFPKLIGTRLGMSMRCAGIGLLVGSPVAGVIFDKHGWVGLQAWAGSLITISALCMLSARGAKFGWALRTTA
jgi:predicted MFS family arabinose efflux permease